MGLHEGGETDKPPIEMFLDLGLTLLQLLKSLTVVQERPPARDQASAVKGEIAPANPRGSGQAPEEPSVAVA